MTYSFYEFSKQKVSKFFDDRSWHDETAFMHRRPTKTFLARAKANSYVAELQDNVIWYENSNTCKSNTYEFRSITEAKEFWDAHVKSKILENWDAKLFYTMIGKAVSFKLEGNIKYGQLEDVEDIEYAIDRQPNLVYRVSFYQNDDDVTLRNRVYVTRKLEELTFLD
jgi:hypothetical protein